MSLPSALGALPSAAPALPGGAVAPTEATAPDSGFAQALDAAVAALPVEDTPLAAALPDALGAALNLLPSDPAPFAAAALVAGVAAGTPEKAEGAETTETTDGAGWPPPGLSSLFPAVPLFGAVASVGFAASTTASGASPAAALIATAAAPLNAGKAALNAIGLIAGGAEPNLDAISAPAVDGETTTLRSTAPGAFALLPTGTASTGAIALDPFAAALARQPATLRMPIADKGELTAVASAAVSVGDIAPTDRGAEGFGPLHTTGPASSSRLDLAAAFPAPVPLPSPRFAEDLGARLQWMAQQQGGDATLRIAPEGLGPVEIRMKLDGDRVDLGFQATQADTRQALEQSLPKLREMLAQQGLQLGHADVGHRQGASPQGDEAKGARRFDGVEGVDGETLIALPRERTLQIGGGRGMLDLYA